MTWRWPRLGSRRALTPRSGGRRRARRASPGLQVPHRAPRRSLTWWHRGCRGRTVRVRHAPSAVVPEFEEASGDDVALDLGAAAVNGGGARVQEFGAPEPARRVVAQRDLGAQRIAGQLEERLLRRGDQHLVDRGLRTQALAGVEAVLRGARTGSESPEQFGDGAHVRRVEAARRRAVDQLLEPSLQVGSALPQGRAALEGQKVHGDRPALVHGAEQPVARNDDPVEEDLAELLYAVHRLDGPDGDPRRVHV